jgi:hypothetical protein
LPTGSRDDEQRPDQHTSSLAALGLSLSLLVLIWMPAKRLAGRVSLVS